jgi:hypothetical protein
MSVLLLKIKIEELYMGARDGAARSLQLNSRAEE